MKFTKIFPVLTLDALQTQQDIFNYVVAHLVEQGKPSVSDNGCAYRGDGGCKCAAGWVNS